MQAMRAALAGETRRIPPTSPPFSNGSIAKNYLTEYQAGLLSRGHVDDFFLGQYKILERIGRGTHGGRLQGGPSRPAKSSPSRCCLRRAPRAARRSARFQREARLAVKLKHPNVVRSFQIGEARGIHYLVMEYLEGETLDEVLDRRKRLPPGEAVRLIHQALLGLQHIHEQGLVHRDLKPANLMLIPAPAAARTRRPLKSNIKILDIGLAREFFDENSPDRDDKMELTGEGVLLGTPDYLAPEQARDPRTIDIRADIYSLGCTLYHLLTGTAAVPGQEHSQPDDSARDGDAEAACRNSIRRSRKGLQQIVNWMMAKQTDAALSDAGAGGAGDAKRS